MKASEVVKVVEYIIHESAEGYRVTASDVARAFVEELGISGRCDCDKEPLRIPCDYCAKNNEAARTLLQVAGET